MTEILAEKLYSPLERENVLLSEQKGCCKGSCETKYQIVIDKTMLTDCKKRYTNLAMIWIHYGMDSAYKCLVLQAMHKTS